MAGLDECVVGGFDGCCKDTEGIVVNEFVQDSNIVFGVVFSEVHDGLRLYRSRLRLHPSAISKVYKTMQVNLRRST